MLTLFAAIKPPNSILEAVTRRQKGVEGVRWAPQENLHITLGYFGLIDVEFAEILDRELAQGPGGGFELRLKGCDVFGGSRPHTLWLGLEENAGLAALHTHVRKAARRAHITMEARKYVPHLSLAYMRGGVHLADLTRYLRRMQSFKSRSFFVDEFALYSSRSQKAGPNTYVKEANYPLLGR